ncbi:Ferritin light chain 2 [Myotis brandtii]|uniref:Ferritin light chain 2 n=1 Tax=Myotis brandtii TaxID=109478 RepID=S7N392_MYOBR|nr:Ferritin light chain 2 [Myotis brandtii]
MGSQISQHYSTQVEAAVNRLANLHLRGPLHLPLSGLLLQRDNAAVEGVGHFCEKAEEKAEGAK